MVVYTDAARIYSELLISATTPAPDDTEAVDNVIKNAISQLNTVFRNSLVTWARAKLVGYEFGLAFNSRRLFPSV